MATRHGGSDRVSTKAKLANELALLGALIARTREHGALKQADVAAALKLPASYLSKIENGTRRLDVVEFIHLAQAMNVAPSQLIRDLESALREGSADA